MNSLAVALMIKRSEVAENGSCFVLFIADLFAVRPNVNKMTLAETRVVTKVGGVR